MNTWADGMFGMFVSNDIWFAVQESSSDGWDKGSHDFREAKEMLKKQGHGLIAVIIPDHNFCETEITYDELFSE